VETGSARIEAKGMIRVLYISPGGWLFDLTAAETSPSLPHQSLSFDSGGSSAVGAAAKGKSEAQQSEAHQLGEDRISKD